MEAIDPKIRQKFAEAMGSGDMFALFERTRSAIETYPDDPDVRYGFGWRITGETLWHSGETIGFRNVIVRYRSAG